MTDGFYFGPGPTTLPPSVKAKMQQAVDNIPGHCVGICELSHRSAFFQSFASELEAKLRSLLEVPATHSIALVPAGARHQYHLLLQNFFSSAKKMASFSYGHWSAVMAKWAPEDVVTYTDVHALKRDAHRYDFIQTVSNETVDGTAVEHPLLDHPGLLIDATSDLCLRPIPISRYAALVAATQKALGVAGLSVVIFREDKLQVDHELTATLSLSCYAKSHSLMVTPPVYAWWCCGLMLDWMMAQGGMLTLQTKLAERSRYLYSIIDNNDDFIRKQTDYLPSMQNIVFDLRCANSTDDFFAKARVRGLIGLEGHKSGGDVRINLYHNVTDCAFDSLSAFLRTYQCVARVSYVG